MALCRDFCDVVCRQIAVKLHREALARIHRAGTRREMPFGQFAVDALWHLTDIRRRRVIG